MVSPGDRPTDLSSLTQQSSDLSCIERHFEGVGMTSEHPRSTYPPKQRHRCVLVPSGCKRMAEKRLHAPAENRTRGSTMATLNFTTKPLAQHFFVSDEVVITNYEQLQKSRKVRVDEERFRLDSFSAQRTISIIEAPHTARLALLVAQPHHIAA